MVAPFSSKVKVDNAQTATSSLVRRDFGIPGLGLLLNPVRLLEELTGYLDIDQVDEFRLNYLRYKPDMNCLARYQITANGCITYAYAKAHGSDAGNKIRKAVERPVFNGVLGPGRVVLGASQIVFSSFPNDSKLASLRCIDDLAYRERLFYRVFGPESEWRGSTIGEGLNYKPERRYVVRLERGDGKSALLKFYSDTGYAKARTISRKLSGSRPGFCPETLGRSKKHNVIAYQWQPGNTLRQLDIMGALTESDLSATAESLAEFHTSGRQGLSATDLDSLALQLHALAEQVAVLLPHLQKRAKGIVKQLVGWRSEQMNPRQPVHGDFYDKQVLVSDHKARLIDLDAACLDDPLLDLGGYIAHLERHAGDPGKMRMDTETHKDILISSYERIAGRVHIQQLNRYIALGLFGLIHQPFRDWSAEWPSETEQLLDRVESLFAG